MASKLEKFWVRALRATNTREKQRKIKETSRRHKSSFISPVSLFIFLMEVYYCILFPSFLKCDDKNGNFPNEVLRDVCRFIIMFSRSLFKAPSVKWRLFCHSWTDVTAFCIVHISLCNYSNFNKKCHYDFFFAYLGCYSAREQTSCNFKTTLVLSTFPK